ncbi:DNA topoisomerase I [uncultured Methanosphaera sp.]|uniref:DNA topoisomerase I n=1 Tax=uncultured Methanosphaera sp. TaxID=262501 RepID=UPI000DC2C563|nr:DNA topoisomerase I [uncultured Methanosphaera sp.]RAP44627.1 MAG: DNA topoisomerase I [Methanosphaera sp. SHI1033]
MNELIICEKPKVAEKVAKALSDSPVKNSYKRVPYYEIVKDNGEKTTVLSAVGHLFSLKATNKKDKRLFDVEWVPLSETDKSKKYVKNYIDTIKKFSKDADRFIHACDYDTEGTLIGYNALRYICGKDSIDKAFRMKFSALTKKDLIKSYSEAYPLKNDEKWADSGEARHVLDFLFGVNISKAMTDSVLSVTKRYVQLSAGRVQTPTLAILTEREKEIQKFVPEPYWLIKAKIQKGIIADHKKGKIFDKKEVDKILENCKGKDAKVTKITTRKTKKGLPVPFELGTLQSEAYAQFGFTPRKTQQIAQNLYVEGYTSYPRTSSQKLPESLGLPNILNQLAKNPKYKEKISQLKEPLKPNEGKKTDEAHPAIHPTGTLPKDISADYQKIYDLITYRFISLFGEPAELESIKVDLNIGEEPFTFSRQRISKEGWLSLDPYQYKKVKNEEFPDISEGETTKAKVKSEEKETKPPARYNQASIIRELEKRGLGTKSTRANIVSILYTRKYVEGKKIEVSQLGEQIIDTLEKYSERITSEQMTREFEIDLDKIKKDELTEQDVIDDAKSELTGILDKVDENKENIGKELYGAYEQSRIVGECSCGGNLIIISSPRGGKFVGCSNYPKCKKTYSLPSGANVLKTKCEKCGLPLISYGKPRQRACLDFECANGGKKSSNDIVGKCPECGNDLIKRMGRYGEFIGCTGFPKCRFTSSIADFEKAQTDAEKTEAK